MKKIYSLAAALIAGSVVFAQNGNTTEKIFSKPTESVETELPSGMESRKTVKHVAGQKSNVVYSYDFSDPNLAGWTQFSYHPDYQFFEWTNTGQTYFTPNPSLEFASPTASNGYALLDIGKKTLDALGQNGLLKDTVLVTLQSPVIDLSGVNNPKITFFQQFRHCCHFGFAIWLDISTDGGASFSTNNSINITDGVPRNSTGDEVFGGIEMTAVIAEQVAANPSNVVLRFRWDSSVPDGNGQTSDVYFWHIDDIVIEENLDYDLEMKTVYYGDAVNQFDYKQIPTAQVKDYLLGARVRNNGNMTQEVQIQARITNTAGYDQSFLSPKFTMGTLFDTTVFFPTFTNPPAGYVYTVDYSFVGDDVAKDQKTENDEGSTSLRVTERVYSHDPGTWNGTSVIQSYKKGADYIPYNIGLFYNGYEAGTVHYVNAIFPNHASTPITVGQQVLVDFFKQNDPINIVTGDFDANYPLFTVYLDITQDMITEPGAQTVVNHIALPDGGAPIEAGQLYFVQFSVNGGTEMLNFAHSGEADDNATRVFGDLGSAGARWYGTDDAPVIRLNLASENTDGVAESVASTFAVGQNQPNPFNERSIIAYTLKETGSVALSVVDITGKEVMNVNYGQKAAGNYHINLNADDFTAGIYFYTLNVNGKTVTKKMVITE